MSGMRGMGQWSRESSRGDDEEPRCQARYVPHGKDFTVRCGRPSSAGVVIEGECIRLCSKCHYHHAQGLREMDADRGRWPWES